MLKTKLLLLVMGQFLLGVALIASDGEWEKYWFYRKRFKEKFVIIKEPSECSVQGGYSIPLASINAYHPDNKTYNFKAFHEGDGTTRHGWYIGTLATEYKLLQLNSQPTDYTLYELYCAMKAFDALDAVAEKIYKNNFDAPCEKNGFFIRDNVSHEFAMEYINKSKWISSEYKIAAKLEFEANKINKEKADYNQYYLSGFIAEKQKIDNGRGEITGDFMSKDQMTHMMLGLALVKKCFENKAYTFQTPEGKSISYNFQQEAIDMVIRMVSNIKKVDISTIDKFQIGVDFVTLNFKEFGNDLGRAASATNLHIVGPDGVSLAIRDFDGGSDFFNKNPGDGYFFYMGEIYGFFEMVKYFTGSNPYASAGSNGDFWSFSDDLLKSNIGTEWGQAITCILASIGNSWRRPNEQPSYVEQLVSGKCYESGLPDYLLPFYNNTADNLDGYARDPNKKRYLFPLLHRYLHYPNHSERTCHGKNYEAVTNISAAEYLAELSTAPCNGPQFMYGSNVDARDFKGKEWWRVNNRFEKPTESRTGVDQGKKIHHGEMDGSDYMLFHNLYRLNYDPNTSILTQQNIIDNNLYNDKTINIRAEEKIESSASIQSRTYEIRDPIDYDDDDDGNPKKTKSDPNRPDPKRTEAEENEQGESKEQKLVTKYASVNYKAGKNIKLTSGFKVNNGASFSGKIEKGIIENYNCDPEAYAPPANIDLEIFGPRKIEIVHTENCIYQYKTQSYKCSTDIDFGIGMYSMDKPTYIGNSGISIELKTNERYIIKEYLFIESSKYTISPNPETGSGSKLFLGTKCNIDFPKTGFYKLKFEIDAAVGGSGSKEIDIEVVDKYIEFERGKGNPLRKEDSLLIEEVSVFPNPAYDMVNIACIHGTIINVTASDIFGTTLFTYQKPINGTQEFDISSFISGIYIFSIETETKKYQFKVSKN